MAEATGWKKPEDVMKQLREKKKALQARFNETSGNIISSTAAKDASASPFLDTANGTSCKRKNPFRRSPVKKLRTDTRSPAKVENHSSLDPEADNTLFHLLNGPQTSTQSSVNYDLSSLLRLSGTTKEEEKTQSLETLEVDWSLKTKVRFTSKSPFSCGSTLKTSEEASGITGFVRCVAAGNTDSWTSLDTSTNAQIHQCCLYWQHPHLPWLQLYPRNTVSSVSSSSQSCTIGLDEKIAQTLANDWCESLRSLFGLLRARQCPFIYVCCPQFTILFRAAGIGGINETHALLTPSTKGLRENLNSEDIVFSMPLQRKKTSDSLNDDASHSESETEDETEDEWIKNIEIQPNLRLQLEAERRKDGGQSTTLGSGSDSLLLIQGMETQGLFNWLLSTKICTPSSGPLVGIPPTLLAPVAFHNATLRPLKTRQAVVKQDGQSMFSLELLGPILPSSFSSLCQLFGSMDFTVTAATLSGTEPFTRVRTEDPSACVSSAFNKESLSDCGLEPQVLEIFCAAQVSPLVSELRHSAGRFHFSK